MSARTGRWAAAALVSAVLLAGCGGDGDDPTVQATEATPTAAAPATPCDDVPEVQEPRPSTSTDLAVQPVVEPSEELPPCGLVVRDVVVGEGAEVVEGVQVQARYVGAFYETGEVFDASWRRGPESTLPFQAGGGNLIPGFDQGVLGMREGGRREIVIPSELGYGPTGQGPIPPNSTLVFVIDIVSAAAS
ncbi:MAG TPA: FKBP-type peptidyl-prolyl cis-trans isomerase [Mycobacteriales bacterium]|nr:FKBP-type peptidyl-prolyl cis-trans isomerase [Mycobacteriales bacterium]